MMTDNTQSIAKHYSHGGLFELVLAKLTDAGYDPDNLRAEDLYPFDQLHGRGVAATVEHVEGAGITRDMHVLDVGCGVGGTARYLATTIGCRVTGIDLTAEYIDIARELTRRCGLGELVGFEQANALDLPFPDGTFDHAVSQNVTMNIPDKTRFAAEIARVLKPGGKLSSSEFSKGPGGDPIFPVPWAREAADSFLVTPEEMRAAYEAGGLRVIEWIDRTEARVAASGPPEAEKGTQAPNPLNGGWLFGEDWVERRRNSGKSAEEGRTVAQFILAEKG